MTDQSEPCNSVGPRIGESRPICGLTWPHEGNHRPDPEDGWGNVTWGAPR